MKSLPISKDQLGYTETEIKKICKECKIEPKIFWKAFGVNTVAIGKDGKARYYRCDVEKALYSLNNPLGKYHPWD